MNCYILVWHPFDKEGKNLDRQKILDYLETDREIVNWRASTGAVYLVSNQNAWTINDKLHRNLPDLKFIVSPIRIDDIWGWTDAETWEFIRRPRPVGQK